MTYSKAVFHEIMQGYEKRRNEAARLQRNRKAEIYDKISAYRLLDHQIADLSAAAAERSILGDTLAASKAKSGISALTEQKKALLIQNGYPDTYLDPVYNCPDCKDTGYIGTEKCHCLKQRIIDAVYRRSNIYPKLNEENFNTFSFDYFTGTALEEMKQIYKICRHFVDEFANIYKNMLFYGEVGSGKTFLSNCIAKALIDQGYSVVYITAPELFNILNDHVFRRNTSSYDEEAYHILFTSPLLIIDDLGTEVTNSATMVSSELFEILNERDIAHHSTIISSNLSFDQLKDNYSERSFSRLLGNYETIRFNGNDIRLMKRRQS